MDRRKAISGLGVLISGTLLSPAALQAGGFSALPEDPKSNGSVRKRKTLSDNWKFQVDIKDIGEKESWFNLEYEKADWGKAHVPQAWDTYEEALWEYEGIGWYMTTIRPQDFLNDKRTQLIFHRVMYYSKVWLNGEYLGENIGGYLPFDFDISRFLKAGVANTVIIRVDNKPRIEWLPAAKDIEWIQYGGILQKVELTGTAHTYIEDFSISSRLLNGRAIVSCRADVVNETASSKKMELDIAIGQGKNMIRKSIAFETGAGANSQVNLDIGIEHPRLWSPETPVLYSAVSGIREKGILIDEVAERFGIRTISTDGRNILLNGKPLLIKGVNRYDDYGRMGTTVPEKLLREELALMKSVGINLIRVHYPQSPDLLSLYDEYGFVMMEEVPLNWWGRHNEQSMEILKQAKPALTRMIKRDKNHPCVIIWSMSNECVTDSEVGIAVMRDLLIQAKSLDPTRLVTYVIDGGDDPVKNLALDKADIICINKYFLVRNIADIEEMNYKPFVKDMTRHRNELPDKPMLVSEFGIQGIKNIHGDVSPSEEFQSAYIEKLWEGIKGIPGLSGGVLWCWADYYHRKYYIRYAAFGPYGVVTTDRKPKKSLDALTRMYGGSRAIEK